MTSEKERHNKLVIVNTKLSYLWNKDNGFFAAHSDALGLTAYGPTRDEAELVWKRLFNKFIHDYRNIGQLKERLDCAKVDWWWGDEYPKDAPEYEDTNTLDDHPAEDNESRWVEDLELRSQTDPVAA